MILVFLYFFFFNDTATTEIYTLSLHDALPICRREPLRTVFPPPLRFRWRAATREPPSSSPLQPSWRDKRNPARSEEHTSELQSRLHLVCRLLLEKKKIQDQ